TAAVTGRFAEKDLLSILHYQAAHVSAEPTRASETHSLQPGTGAWSSFGTTTPDTGSGISEPDANESDLC
ncbi:IS21 family transposase, partial [Streptomyces sp. NPDC057428]